MKYYEKFLAKLETILKEEDYTSLKNKQFFDKGKYISMKFKEILEDEDSKFISDVAVNKKEYIKTVCCNWEKLYKELNPEQKILALIHTHRTYYFDENKDRVYLKNEEFLKAVDNGEIENYKVSIVGNVTDYMREIDGVSESDVLFWLQHEWHKLSGDWFNKLKGKRYIVRTTTKFTPKTYRAFNEIFKLCFGRELKCIDKYKDRTVIGDFKKALDN